MAKTFVEVVVRYDLDGNYKPVAFIAQSGKTYEVECKEVTRAASLKSGGQGMRYKCKIKDTQTFVYLFIEYDNRWFVEKVE